MRSLLYTIALGALCLGYAPADACDTMGNPQSASDITYKIKDNGMLNIPRDPDCSRGMVGAYIPVEVCNNTATCFDNLDVIANVWNTNDLSDPSNPSIPEFCESDCWNLGNGQHDTQHIQSLAANTCITQYWYIQSPCRSNWSKKEEWLGSVYFFTIDEDMPDISFAYTMRRQDGSTPAKLRAREHHMATPLGNPISYTLTSNDHTVGGGMCMEVNYAVGNVEAGGFFAVQPAGNADFDAGMYNLTSARLMWASPQLSCITAVDNNGNPTGDSGDDRFIFRNASDGACESGVIRMEYCFRVNAIGDTDIVPYSVSSGVQTSGMPTFSDTPAFASANISTFSSNSGGLDYVFPNEEAGLLPLQLAAFQGESHGDGIQLRWVSVSEEVYGFKVEKMDADGEFHVIGEVLAFGNDGGLQEYHFTDELPAQDNRYRLRVVNWDTGSFHSGEVMIEGTKEGVVQAHHIYPNPNDGRFTLAIETLAPADVSVIITDLQGRVVSRQDQIALHTGGNTIPFDLSGMNAGMYFYGIISPQGQQTGRFMIH